VSCQALFYEVSEQVYKSCYLTVIFLEYLWSVGKCLLSLLSVSLLTKDEYTLFVK